MATEGFHSIEELAYADPEELSNIEGFDESIVSELIRRAEAYLADQENILEKRRQELGVSDDLVALEVFSNQMLVTLGEKGIKTLDNLADLAGDELVEIFGEDILDQESANNIIMSARAHWFHEDEAARREE